MGKELIISGSRHETRLAVLEDDQLVEVYFQRTKEYSLAGSIHKGRVTRVLPGMQSAFVDIGLDRDAFLYVSDFFEENEEYDKMADDRPHRAPRPEPKEQPAPEPVAAAEPAPPAVEPAAEGRDDRRSRRSRRRRTRGRGFPESKYASDLPRREEEEAPAAEPVAEESEEVFPVLPGESLAKYRAPGGEESGEPDEAEAPENGAGAFEAESESESEAEELSSALPIEIEEDTASFEELYREEREAPAESAKTPDIPAVVAEEAPEETEPAGEIAAETEEAVMDPVAEMASKLAETAEAAEESDGEPSAEGAETEPFAVEAVADEDIEAEPAAQAGAEGEEVPEPAADEVEPARMPVSLTATLRERGDRYVHHRVSRRMRRKMRGGPNEGRAEGERVEEAPRPVAAEEAPEPQVETPVRASREKAPLPLITDLLREGQEVLVQIAKEPLGQKGARITSHIAMPGRYVVYMPTVDHLGVSRKIASDEERLRLKRILQTHRPTTAGGFIVRTAGEGKTEEEIASDMRFLYNHWLDIRRKAEAKSAPVLLHHDLDLVQRTLRDQMTESFKSIWVDNEEIYESVLRFVERFQPGAVHRVKLWTRSTPIFDAFNVTQELEKALRPKVWLKSGGYIVINQTEALVAIDVNTGKFVGKSNRLEDTIVKTNTEAVKEIVRQVRLRDLGGIIVVDFIDMDERKNRQKVMQALEEAMRADRAPNKILQFNDFGLVAITRKRVKQSLERTLCSPCPYCEGAGYVKSVQTVIGEIIQEAHKLASVIDGKEAMLRVHPDVAKVLKSTENRSLEELEEIVRRPVLVTSDPMLHQEKFDLV